MLYDLTTVKARQAVRVAKETLRKAERRFDRYPGEDQERYISEIRAAEEQLAIARFSLGILQGNSAPPPDLNSDAASNPANRRSQDKSARPGGSDV